MIHYTNEIDTIIDFFIIYFELQVQLSNRYICSEGGTSEELRTDPHLKFSSVVQKVVKNRKKLNKILTKISRSSIR